MVTIIIRNALGDSILGERLKMTFLQWLKKHKNDTEDTQRVAEIVLKDKDKPKRCKCMDKWTDYLQSRKADDELIKAFYQIWKRFAIQSRLEKLEGDSKKVGSFLDDFQGKKRDTVLFSKITKVFDDMKWEISKEKDWFYLASNHWDQIFFRPSENEKGFILLSEYAPPEMLLYGATEGDIKNRIAHLLEFNEAYKFKYHKK
jgi:uncharacterized protein YozE (UPF0346 family)